jgi:hypothetical protein
MDRDECSNCGIALTMRVEGEPPAPCPSCGATSRRLYRNIADRAGGSDSLAVGAQTATGVGTAYGADVAPTRLAEHHFTVLIDRTSEDALFAQLIDEDGKREPEIFTNIGPDDDLVLGIAVSISEWIGDGTD